MLRPTHVPVLGKSCEQIPSVGCLALELAASSYAPGETLRGLVRLTLDKQVNDAMVSVHARAWQSLRWITVAEGTTVGKLERVHKHLDAESYLGDLNGSLATGTHEFPFSVELPADLLTNVSVANVSRRNIEKIVRGWIELTYDVTAKLEVAGLSNTELQQRVAFTAMPPKSKEQSLAKPVAVERTEHIKFMGLGGNDTPCTLRLSMTSDHVALPAGPIVVHVEIDLPVNRKLLHVHLVLYEDVSITLDYGTKLASRAVCSRKFKVNHLMRVDDSSTKLRGTLELAITNKDESSFGVLVPAFDATFMHIRHRMGVECSFVLGSRVTLAAPIVIYDPSLTACETTS